MVAVVVSKKFTKLRADCGGAVLRRLAAAAFRRGLSSGFLSFHWRSWAAFYVKMGMCINYYCSRGSPTVLRVADAELWSCVVCQLRGGQRRGGGQQNSAKSIVMHLQLFSRVSSILKSIPTSAVLPQYLRIFTKC